MIKIHTLLHVKILNFGFVKYTFMTSRLCSLLLSSNSVSGMDQSVSRCITRMAWIQLLHTFRLLLKHYTLRYQYLFVLLHVDHTMRSKFSSFSVSGCDQFLSYNEVTGVPE